MGECWQVASERKLHFDASREKKNGSKKVFTVRYLNVCVCVCECWLKLVFPLHFVYIFIRFAFLFELENFVAFCGFAGLMRSVKGKNGIIHYMHIVKTKWS